MFSTVHAIFGGVVMGRGGEVKLPPGYSGVLNDAQIRTTQRTTYRGQKSEPVTVHFTRKIISTNNPELLDSYEPHPVIKRLAFMAVKPSTTRRKLL